LQHFKGWTIKTNTSCFDPSIATIMDFSIDQKNETRFFYLLPKKNNEALIEFTLFTKNLIEEKEYESEIKKYISSLNIKDYEIISKEKGVIPMTCYPYDKYNSSNLINIGTAGGWTKPSSGYTFRFIDKFSDKLISFLISGRSFKNFKFRNRYWFYDLIFLDVLFNKNSVGSVLFETMFKKNSFSSIFRFLDNEGSYWDDLRIINSFPKLMFIKSFLKNIPRIISTYL
jgi:lycopene beta-cyclase